VPANLHAERWLEQGDTVTVGNLVLDVIHCPGHTPGHVVFFHQPSRFAVVGDVLFQGGIGRWDFPLGNLTIWSPRSPGGSGRWAMTCCSTPATARAARSARSARPTLWGMPLA
jgi:hypothetical protein